MATEDSDKGKKMKAKQFKEVSTHFKQQNDSLKKLLEELNRDAETIKRKNKLSTYLKIKFKKNEKN